MTWCHLHHQLNDVIKARNLYPKISQSMITISDLKSHLHKHLTSKLSITKIASKQQRLLYSRRTSKSHGSRSFLNRCMSPNDSCQFKIFVNTIKIAWVEQSVHQIPITARLFTSGARLYNFKTKAIYRTTICLTVPSVFLPFNTIFIASWSSWKIRLTVSLEIITKF